MKNIVSFILFSILPLSLYSQGMTLEEARKVYAESMHDKATCEAAYKKIASVQNSDNHLLMGYKAAITVAMSKHLKTTKEKISHFNNGKQLMESSIVKDAKNVELRFLRFTIQSNCPAVLKYNKSLTTDKLFIIDNLTSVQNTTIRSRIKDFLLQSKNITIEEKQKLNAI